MSTHALAWLLPLLFLLPAPLAAQSTATAGLRGLVRDAQEATIANAAVTVRHTPTGSVSRTASGDTGVFLFSGLAPGRYELSVQAAGFRATTVTAIDLALSEVRTLTVTLEISPSRESVTVTAEPLLTEPARATFGQAIGTAEVQSLPVNSRNFVQLTLITPNVVTASNTGSRGYMGDRYRESQFSFSGQRYQFNTQTIDGADATVFVANAVKSFYSLESIQEFRVLNHLYTVEQGRAMGGIINVVTRSGTSQWHGRLFAFARNSRLDSRDLLTLPEFALFRRGQFGATGGGPVVRDRLFAFAAYEGQRQARSPRLQPIFLSNLTAINAALMRLGFPAEDTGVLQTADSNQGLLRWDWAARERHRALFRYNRFETLNRNDRIGSGGGAGDAVTTLGARNHTLRDESFVASLQSVVSPRLVNSALVALHRHSYELAPRPDVPPIELIVVGAFSSGALGADERSTAERKTQASDGVSWHTGTHQLRVGSEVLSIRSSTVASGGSSAVFPNLQALLAPEPQILQLRLFESNPTVPLTATQFGLYAQDQWQVRAGLALTFGVRYDLELIGGLHTLTRSDRNNLQPRLGIAWSLGRSVLRAGAGLFTGERYHPLLTVSGFVHGRGFPSFSGDFLDAHPFARRYRPLPDNNRTALVTGPETVATFRDFVRLGRIPASTAGQQIAAISHPALPNPHAGQWGVEYERQLGADWLLSAGYTGLRSANIPVLVNRNLRPATAMFANGKRDYQASGAGAAARLYDPAFNLALVAEPRGDSSYHALTLAARRRFARRFSLSAHYALASARDNASAVSAGTGWEDTYDPAADWARSSEFSRHRGVLALTVEVPERVPVLGGVGASLLSTVQSPRYFNVTAGTDVNRDLNANTDRPDRLPRNSFRGDDLLVTDVRLLKRLRVLERWELEAMAEVYNVFNRGNITDLNTVYGQATLALPPGATFSTPRQVGNARQVQLGLRLTL